VRSTLPTPVDRLERPGAELPSSDWLRLLEEAVGLDARRQRLERYATWTDEDLEDFETTLRDQRQVDDELWR
jgi:hypothetical protein